jgi:hypothetical protein
MTSPSSRIRVTISTSDHGLLHWLAVESGNDDSTEAALLLKMGIRLAVRRCRRLYGSLPIDPADQATLELNTPGEAGYKTGRDRVRELEHLPIGDYEVDPGDPPLVLPDWTGGDLSTPHRERGFGGHGKEDSK